MACAAFVVSCDKPVDEAHIITVASKKLLDEVCQNKYEVFAEVYAVRVGESDEWTPVNAIEGFEYEEGYEYRLKVEAMPSGDNPSVKVLEVVSKEGKTSENLPKSFIDTFVPIEVSYFVDADYKDIIESDLLNNPDIPWNCHYSFTEGMYQWAIADGSQTPLMHGSVERNSVGNSEMPEVFKLLPPDSQVHSMIKFTFVSDDEENETGRSYYAFICTHTRSQAPMLYRAWLYEDMTEHYKVKYPAANVKAVVVRHTF